MGIMAGCTISPLELVKEVITRGFQWVMVEYDASSTRSVIYSINRLLERVNKNLKWSRMKFKPNKLKSTSLSSGKLSDRKFVIDDENQTFRDKSVKSLGRWYSTVCS